MFERDSVRRIYRASAWYDLLVSAPFATAASVSVLWPVLAWVQKTLTGRELVPLDAHGMLFANFFGAVVVVWALVRLIWDDTRLARFDALGRLLFSIAMIRALAHGAMPLLYVFVVVEVSFGVLQLMPTRGRPWMELPSARVTG